MSYKLLYCELRCHEVLLGGMFFFFFFLCMCMCLQMLTHMGMYSHVCGDQSLMLSVFLNHFPTYILWYGLSFKPRAHQLVQSSYLVQLVFFLLMLSFHMRFSRILRDFTCRPCQRIPVSIGAITISGHPEHKGGLLVKVHI